jgi:hypothetical protein
MKTKKTNPNSWCKGLYLSAGVYKENYTLKQDTPVEFISTAILKLKGLPITIRRVLLSEDVEVKIDSSDLDKRIDFMVNQEQFEYLKEKSLKESKSVSDILRNIIFASAMEDYSGTEEAKKESKWIKK